MVARFLLLLSVVLTVSSLSYIVPGAPWYDTDGNIIQAHGAGILTVGKTHYWFGEDKVLNSALFHAVAVYTSTDLFTWTRLPDALSPIPNTSISNDSVVERPKVVYNVQNAEYVMWFHSDNANYTAAQVGVAKSKNPAGPYQYMNSFKPLGADSRDESVFLDEDGIAYLLYASDNNVDFKIAQMDQNYYNVTSVVYMFTGKRYEAPGIIKRNGIYNLIVSYQSSWTPNANKLLTAPLLSGPWSNESDIAPPASRTFNSQNAYDFVVGGNASTSLSIYMGDRWRSDVLGSSRYIWLPVNWNENGTPLLTWADIWTFDPDTNMPTFPSGKMYSASVGVLSGSANLSTCASCITGQAVTWLGAGGSVTLHGITGTGAPQWISVYYANGDSSYRNVTLSVNGGPSITVDQPDTGSTAEFLSVPVKLTLNDSNDNYITFAANQTSYAGDLNMIVVYDV